MVLPQPRQHILAEFFGEPDQFHGLLLGGMPAMSYDLNGNCSPGLLARR